MLLYATKISLDLNAPAKKVPVTKFRNDSHLFYHCTFLEISGKVSCGYGSKPFSWKSRTGMFAKVAGTHTFTITDSNGVVRSSTITITQNSTAPTVAITNNSAVTALNCTVTSINVTATGATNYTWSNGLGSNASVDLIAAGTYTVTGTAANGCTGTATITITQNTTAPTISITNNTGGTQLSCTTNSINVTATGGSTYVWSNGLGNNAAATILLSSNPRIIPIITKTTGIIIRLSCLEATSVSY